MQYRWAGEMAPWGQALAAKPGDLSSMPGTRSFRIISRHEQWYAHVHTHTPK